MREHIIREIKRLAASSDGQPPGATAFESATGIISSKWRGKYWARWGDALTEAGFQPNSWTAKSDPNIIFEGLTNATRHYGHFPTNSELQLLRNSDSAVPSSKTVQSNFGSRGELINAFREFLSGKAELVDVLAVLPLAQSVPSKRPSSTKSKDGSVYLIKSGAFYKIGRSDEIERRMREIRIALPDKSELMHAIATDDPAGIEAYWHRRFADRRANGEWFKLSADDIKAFMRRKFQ